jgi:hypothetical protein
VGPTAAKQADFPLMEVHSMARSEPAREHAWSVSGSHIPQLRASKPQLQLRAEKTKNGFGEVCGPRARENLRAVPRASRDIQRHLF